MAFTVHMQPSSPSPFGTPNHQATPTAGQGHQQQQQQPLFFTPQQPRTNNPFQLPGQNPFSFSSLQANSTPKPAVEATGSEAGMGQRQGQGQGQQKGYRYRSRGTEFKPLTSSPLARSSKINQGGSECATDDDDEDDDRFSQHHPSSPLGRVSCLPPPTSGTINAPGSTSTTLPGLNLTGMGRSSRRRPKSLGHSDDDDDDELNPSPLVQRRRAQYKPTGPSTLPKTTSIRRFSLPPTSVSATSSMSWSSPSPTSSPPVAALFERPRNHGDGEEDPRRAFLRERFKKRYFARATKAREKAVKARRRRVEGTEDYFASDKDDEESDDGRRRRKGKGKAISDDEDLDMDASDEAEEGEDEILNDELFSRIVANTNRKLQHAYRVSYAREIGSSFDPDIEDVSRWEEELRAEPVHNPHPQHPFPRSSSSSRDFPPSSSALSFPSTPGSSSPGMRTIRPDIGSSPPRAPTEYEYDGDEDTIDEIPDEFVEDFADLEDAELEAYAEEYARVMEQQAHEAEQQQQQTANNPTSGTGQQTDANDVLAGLEDIPEEELFGEWNWSESEAEGPGKVDEGDVDMDWS